MEGSDTLSVTERPGWTRIPFVHGKNVCDGCEADPILGNRYRPIDPNRDLDYCDDCYKEHLQVNSTDYRLAKDDRDQKLQEVYLLRVGWAFRLHDDVDSSFLVNHLRSTDGMLLKWLPPIWQQDANVVLAACENNPNAIRYASPQLYCNREFALSYAGSHSNFIRAFSNGNFQLAAKICGPLVLAFNDDKEFMLLLVQKNGLSLQHATSRLRSDKELVSAACRNQGYALHFASPELKGDKDVVLAACARCGDMLSCASDEIKDDREVLLEILQVDGDALQYASDRLRADKALVRVACAKAGDLLSFASDTIKDDKEFIMGIVKMDGSALQFASKRLRADKDVVLTAAMATPSSLKYALESLNQEPDCLVAAGIWDRKQKKSVIVKELGQGNNNQSEPLSKPKAKIVLSTRFSLEEKSTSTATEFTVAFKKHKLIQDNFVVYSPNAYAKSTCDPDWTNTSWPCMGTYATCLMQDDLKPQRGESLSCEELQPGCCWRYSFRHQLETAKEANNGGAMVQVVEYDSSEKAYVLGNGQKIESRMARDVGIKVFRYYATRFSSSEDTNIESLVLAIQAWQGNDCSDMSVCDVSSRLWSR